MKYIGESDRTLQKRFSDHRGYVSNRLLKKATGYHFNQPGHSLSDMEVTIVEKLHSQEGQFRRIREKNYIQIFNTKHKGMNKYS